MCFQGDSHNCSSLSSFPAVLYDRMLKIERLQGTFQSRLPSCYTHARVHVRTHTLYITFFQGGKHLHVHHRSSVTHSVINVYLQNKFCIRSLLQDELKRMFTGSDIYLFFLHFNHLFLRVASVTFHVCYLIDFCIDLFKAKSHETHSLTLISSFIGGLLTPLSCTSAHTPKPY